MLVNCYSYAYAMYEALVNDGLTTRYTQDELHAFRIGLDTSLYATLDGLGETCLDLAASIFFYISV